MAGTWETALGKERDKQSWNEFVCLGGFLASKKQWEASAGQKVTRTAARHVRGQLSQ